VALAVLGAGVPAEPVGHRTLPLAAAGPHHLVQLVADGVEARRLPVEGVCQLHQLLR